MKPYSKIGLFLRSLAFSIYSISTMVLYSFIFIFAFAIPAKKRHALLRAYMYVYMWVLKKTCHIDVQVEGMEHIGKNNGIIFCKHQSTFETFFLPLLFHDAAIIIKKELLFIPFFGWGLAAADPIAINRKNKSSAMQQIIAKGISALKAGRWIIIFPEGTRVAPGTIGHYRLGGARLASASGYAVLPIAHNAGQHWPRRQFIKQPGTIRFVIGKKISSEGRDAEEILELAKGWIEDTMKRL